MAQTKIEVSSSNERKEVNLQFSDGENSFWLVLPETDAESLVRRLQTALDDIKDRPTSKFARMLDYWQLRSGIGK